MHNGEIVDLFGVRQGLTLTPRSKLMVLNSLHVDS